MIPLQNMDSVSVIPAAWKWPKNDYNTTLNHSCV